MKKLVFFFLLVFSFVVFSNEIDCSQCLSLQDVPVFSEEGNPLTGLRVFHLIPPLAFPSNVDLQQRIQKSIETKLTEIGQVIRLKENDMRGFGAGTILLTQIGEVIGWNNRQMPFSRVSVQIETSATVNQTSVNAFAAIWATNAFFKGGLDSDNK